MALQIVSGSEQINTPVGGTKIDSGSFREAALAPGKLAQSIGQNVGGLFEDVSQKMQANQNAQQVFRADLTMRRSKDDFDAQLAKMPDPGTWLPAWKQHVDQQREAILSNPKVGPDVRRVLDQKFNVWEAATTASLRTKALRKSVADSKEDAIADSTYAAHQGDIEGAQNILKAAVDHYALSPSDANRIGKRFPTIAAQAQADVAISTNPIKAPELIKQFEGVMEPRMFVAIQARAREAQNQARAGNLNDMAVDMDNSPDGTLDPKTISAAVKDGRITQRGADGLIARMEKKNVATAKDDFAVAMMDAQDHDWTEDKTPDETAREMKDAAASLPPALRLRAYNHIDKLKNDAAKKGEKEEKPVQKEAFNRLKEDREKNGLTIPMSSLVTEESSGFLGFKSHPASVRFEHVAGGLKALDKLTDEQVKERFGKDATVDKVKAAEELHYAQQQGKLRDWFKANPDATDEQAEKFRQQLEHPYITAAVSAQLLKGHPTAVTTEEEYNALPSNAPFIWNGRVGTKK